MRTRAVKGVKDILPEEMARWRFIESESRKTFEEHGFSEIRIPIFEYTDLFARSIGEETDIVEKEMYTFTDSKGESISLRPEGTAGVVRACIEHNRLQGVSVNKLFYLGPMFRHERPQKGRYRQFYQIGAEALGTENPLADAEILTMLHLLFQRLGVRDTVLQINSLGCKACRPTYREALTDFLAKQQEGLCENCQRRSRLNPLRVLDCKSSTCKAAMQNAPTMLASLCRDCMAHFEAVKKPLDELGISYEANHRLVRGLDYYTRTAFEMVTEKLGAQNAVAAGGRYDGLVEELGGPPTAGIGFAIGVERLVALLPERDDRSGTKPLYLAPLGDEAMERVALLLYKLRSAGVTAETSYQGNSLKSQLRQAGKLGAAFVGILGEDELNEGVILVKDMDKKEQLRIPLDRFVEEMTQQLAQDHS